MSRIGRHPVAVPAGVTVTIEEGNKVKVYIMFRGRQMAHTEVGYGILADFLARVEDIAW